MSVKCFNVLMIKRTQNEIGSVHVIVTIVLLAAVIGLLGFIFWQNFFWVAT